MTLGSDGGHKSTAGFDGRFAMDDEALANFGKQSVKKAHDAAMAVIAKAYGRAPERFYFIGGSQGGHEALDAAARYPATTTASWRTTPPTTSRCSTSGRSTPAARSTKAAARRG